VEKFPRRISFLFLIVLFLSCERISAIDVSKERALLQEMLMQSFYSDNITCTSILQGNDSYTLQFSNGNSIGIHSSVIPLVYIGNNGNWFLYGKDIGRSAYDYQTSIPSVEIIQGYWYIDDNNTGVEVIGQDSKDAPYIYYIVEKVDNWTFYFSDSSIVDVKKTPTFFNIENEVVSKYLNEVSYDNSDYSYTLISSYRAKQTDYRKDLPSPIIIKWDNRSYDYQNLELVKKEVLVTDNDKYRLLKDISTSDNSFYINNLIPNTEYCVKVADCFSDGSKQVILNKKLVVKGHLRMLEIDGEGTWNFRDLGGWKSMNGKSIKYGRLIRGGGGF